MPILEIKLPPEILDLVKTVKPALIEGAWWDGARTGGFAVGLVILIVYVFSRGVNVKKNFLILLALGAAFAVTCLPGPSSPVPRAFAQEFGASQVGGYLTPSGKEIHCHLDERFHIKNRGGSDGAGLCVFASVDHTSIHQHVREVEGIFKFMWTKPGGGWPEKVDKIIDQICSSRGDAVPSYVQYEGRDLSILKTACKSGRMPGVTYGYSPTGRYNGQRIAHMVSLCHADDEWFGVLDNNYPKSIEWMDPATFGKVFTSGSANGWAVIFLNPGPPPVPTN